jgi:uncharacterized protein YdiU (UPF0061 family)
LPLFDADAEKAVELANSVIQQYGERFQIHWLRGMREKIGLSTVEDGDLDLIQSLLAAMQASQADLTLAFRRLSDAVGPGDGEALFLSAFREPDGAREWLARWRDRLTRDEGRTEAERRAAMRSVNPAFIPRNHRIEQAINAAVEDADFSLFEALLAVLAKPYDDQPDFAAYMEPPKPEERVLQTFCGT